MKPTINTKECEKIKDVIVVTEPPKRDGRKRRCLLISAIACIFLFAAVSFIGVYLGMKTHKGITVTYWATYHRKGDFSVTETIDLTETEERVTGEITAVVDFKKELLVLKLPDYDACYVGNFNTSALLTPESARSSQRGQQFEETVQQEMYIKINLTADKASRENLPDMAGYLCSEVNIYWMTTTIYG